MLAARETALSRARGFILEPLSWLRTQAAHGSGVEPPCSTTVGDVRYCCYARCFVNDNRQRELSYRSAQDVSVVIPYGFCAIPIQFRREPGSPYWPAGYGVDGSMRK